MARLLSFFILIFSSSAYACRPAYCEPPKSLAAAARSSAFVAIGTIFEGHLEIDKIWRGPVGDNWTSSVAFDAYRCCDLYSKSLEGSRWLIVSRTYPPKAIMSEHSQLLPELSHEEIKVEKQLNLILGPARINPYLKSFSDTLRAR